MLTIDEDFEIRIPIRASDLGTLFQNATTSGVATPTSSSPQSDDASGYEQFLADVWVGVVLTLMVLSCVCFMCSCLIYHKFQQWKARVLQSRNADASTLERQPSESELPSYTIASGLPSYEEAIEQLREVKRSTPKFAEAEWVPRTPPTPCSGVATPLSVVNLFPAAFRTTPDVVVVVKS